jgi:hypothetical protein
MQKRRFAKGFCNDADANKGPKYGSMDFSSKLSRLRTPAAATLGKTYLFFKNKLSLYTLQP